ncbi:MAG: hypothetical protein OWT27_07485, partial [Firmicutes bacterium]|nr:hypothetical protein [Bacillota bacterium]
MNRTRIALIDDHPLVRQGLRLILDAQPHLLVCAEGASGDAWTEARDAAMVEMLYGCGLRVGELVGLDAQPSAEGTRAGRGWVDLQAGEVHV